MVGLADYLDFVDAICADGSAGPTGKAKALQCGLNQAHEDLLLNALSIEDMCELSQYIRAHGFVISGTLSHEPYKAYIVAHASNAATGGRIKSPPAYAFMGGMLA
jgi:hypothetical protein